MEPFHLIKRLILVKHGGMRAGCEFLKMTEALVAKNLLKHPFYPTLYDNPILPYDYRSWVGNHIWVHKQPLPLWLMAGSMKIFGISEIALRLPSIIMSTIGIFLTFKIGSYFFNKKIGLFAAIVLNVYLT